MRKRRRYDAAKSLDAKESFARIVKAYPECAPHISWICKRFLKPESELEKHFILLLALKFFNWSFITYRGEVSPFCGSVASSLGSLEIDQQVEIAGRRCDFLFTIKSAVSGGSRRIAVECDGHSFHERTPEQAANDRARDRALLREGVPTLRYTFSELTENPDGAFDDLRLTLIALRNELDGERGDISC